MKTTYISLIVIAVVFIIVSFFVQRNIVFLETIIGDSVLGMFAYILIAILGTIVAPISALPLLPAAVGLWGPNMAAVLSILGWFIGAGFDYEIARRYGKRLVKKIVNIETIEKFTAEISVKYGFVSLLFLRLLLPVDILSYALGLFTLVGRKLYYSTTAIGIIPFAFLWAYLGALNYKHQIGAFLILGILFYIGFKMKTRLLSCSRTNIWKDL